jgi:O-antigen/teichoic acid export membrane protein
LKNVIRSLAFPSDNTTDEEGRSKERYRRLVLTIASSVIAKIASVLTFAVSVPLTIRYLGTERYGMWLTVASLVTMLSCADLGIGNGLLTLIAETYGKEDHKATRRYVSSAFFLLCGIASVAFATALVIVPFVAWGPLLHLTSPDAIRESAPTFLVLIGCLAMNLPLGITQRILSGHQQGYLANLWATLGNCMALGAVVTAVRMHASMPWLVFGIAGAPIAALILSSVWLFGFSRPWLRPSIQYVDVQSAKRLFNMGLLFLVLQVALAVGFQSDNLVLARVLGANKVAAYAVTSRMFGFVPMLLGFVIMPLWPAYGEAFARGDVEWLKRTLKRSLLLVLSIALPVNAILVLAGQSILKLWVGAQVTPTMTLLITIAISQTLMAVASAVSVFLNAINVLKIQAICFASMAVVNIVASVLLTRRLGVPGVVYGSILAQCVCWMLPAAFFVPKLLKSLRPTSTTDELASFGHAGIALEIAPTGDSVNQVP